MCFMSIHRPSISMTCFTPRPIVFTRSKSCLAAASALMPYDICCNPRCLVDISNSPTVQWHHPALVRGAGDHDRHLCHPMAHHWALRLARGAHDHDRRHGAHRDRVHQTACGCWMRALQVRQAGRPFPFSQSVCRRQLRRDLSHGKGLVDGASTDGEGIWVDG